MPRVNRFEYVERATATIASNRRAAAVRRELLSHIDLKCADLVQGGAIPEEAERTALESLGDPILIAEAYHLPRRSELIPPVYWLAVPAFLFSVIVAVRAELAPAWLVAVGVLAIGTVPGESLQQRGRQVAALVGGQRQMAWAGSIAGVAAALGTFGNPPLILTGFLDSVEVMVPALVVLHEAWQRYQHGRDQDPLRQAGVVATSFLVAGGVVFTLGQWRLPNWLWLNNVTVLTAAAALWIPLLVLAVVGGFMAVHNMGSWFESRASNRAEGVEQTEREA